MRNFRSLISIGIYWSAEHANFYNAFTNAGQGHQFYETWCARHREFPQTAEAARAGQK